MSNIHYYWEKFWTFVEEALQGDYQIPVDHLVMPQQEPDPKNPVVPTASNPDVLLADWSLQENAYHNVRVLCDLAGLSVNDKNLICACVYQESEFKNDAVHHNVVNGQVSSTDWGICQINDYFQVGSGRPFTSAQDIVDNPQRAVQFMIQMFGEGELKLWDSYLHGAYKQWLISTSPMWKLAIPLTK